jgi:hypothetical protein
MLSFAKALCLLSATAAALCAADNDNGRVPVLLELFTSEGCSSCPPADHLLQILHEEQPVAGAELIVLSEHVDYWDRLGWKDPFSSPQYSLRQHDYTELYHLDGDYTPQPVVDGRYGFVGSDRHKASTAIQKAIREPKIPISISSFTRNGNQITARIALPASQKFRGAHGLLYVALADNRQESQVARGENKGRALTHVGVTRILKQVGKIDFAAGATKEVTLPVQAGSGNGLRLVAFIQDPRSGHVLGVTEQQL